MTRAPISSSESADLSTAELDQLHRAVRFAMGVESARSVTPPDLSVVDAARFAHAVQRHRLEVCLAPHLEALNVPVHALDVISSRAVASQISAMAVAAVSIEVSALLSKAGLRALIIKGCALAAQTTGDFTARGAGDVDVLVHPDDVEAAVRAFEHIGFSRVPFTAARDFESRQWRYARWATSEFTLLRGTQAIDLHWCLTSIRSALPAFDDLWQRREYVDVSSTLIPTLDPADALDHSCAHSLRDHWRWIRSLVDVDRLARSLPVGGRERLSHSRAVPLTAAAALGATGSRYLVPLATTRVDSAARARRAGALAQRSYLSYAQEPWSPGRVWRCQRQHAQLLSTPSDWAREAARHYLPPSTFIDPVTGDGLPVISSLAQRLRHGVARLAGGPGNDIATGQNHRAANMSW